MTDTTPSFGNPDPELGGDTVDEAVANAEKGSQVEGVHTPSGKAESGDSRLEHMPEVAGVGEPRIDGDPSEEVEQLSPGPEPRDIGSAGAQRIVGARISDRVSAGEPVPDGPPFDSDTEGRH
jgi:hypothetical protein